MSNESNHTPGPWRLLQPDLEKAWIDKRIYVTADDGDTFDGSIAFLPFDDITEQSEVSIIANARLIAAAPEMMDTLEMIAAYEGQALLGNGRYDEGANAAFEECAGIARAALAKARGEEA